jgi:hypothetical protein
VLLLLLRYSLEKTAIYAEERSFSPLIAVTIVAVSCVQGSAFSGAVCVWLQHPYCCVLFAVPSLLCIFAVCEGAIGVLLTIWGYPRCRVRTYCCVCEEDAQKKPQEVSANCKTWISIHIIPSFEVKGVSNSDFPYKFSRISSGRNMADLKMFPCAANLTAPGAERLFWFENLPSKITNFWLNVSISIDDFMGITDGHKICNSFKVLRQKNLKQESMDFGRKPLKP